MARGTLNKVMLIGRLGADPETRYMPSGGAVSNIRLATNDGYKDKQSGEFREHTEWHRVVLFGRLGEIAAEYLKKGGLVYIEGRIRTRKWQDQNNQERTTVEIVASEMQLLGGNANGRESHPDLDVGHESGAESSVPTQAPRSSRASAPSLPPAEAKNIPNKAAGALDHFDDDIPF